MNGELNGIPGQSTLVAIRGLPLALSSSHLLESERFARRLRFGVRGRMLVAKKD